MTAPTLSGSSVVVPATGTSLSEFIAFTSGVKTQDSTIRTVTTGAVGSSSNGWVVLAKSSGAIATLDNIGTLVTQGIAPQGATGSDAPIANMAISLKNAHLVLTNGANVSETTAPIIGDALTRITYKAGGSTWNSIHPGVNLQGSTLVFESGGDGHLSKHPNAVVSNVNLRWTSTSPTDFVLGMHQNWGTDNKPSTLSGLRFVSVLGNYLVSLFTFTGGSTPANLANNGFDVRPDYCYDVAAVGQRPTGIRRSYRRSDFTATASSYWGAVSICPTYLWIDPYTTLSGSGVLDSGKTYLRTVDYIATGNTSTDKCVDVVALRFAPVVVDSVGNKLASVSVTVRNKNAVCSLANPIGSYRARLATSGITDASGKISITEPTAKDYTSNASHRIDSWVHQNRTRTQAWHKWWETGVKLITVSDSRNGTGTTAPELYAAADFEASYRCAGRVFATATLDMSAPQSPTVALSTDGNYNSAASTAGITVSYAVGVTTVALTDGSYTLDAIWKAVIDFHAHPDRNEVESILPFTAWAAGEMRFGSLMQITGNQAVSIGAGSLIKSLASSTATGFNTAANPTLIAPFTDANGDSYLRFDGIDSWTVYADKNRLNMLGSGTGSSNFRFLFSSSANYYLSLAVSGESIAKTLSPSAPGETIVQLSTQSLLVGVIARTNALPTLAQIQSGIERIGGMLDGKASQSSVEELGSPMQASVYVAPDNANIAAIKAKTDALVNGPTLAQIEQSAVLAKQASVVAIPTNPLLDIDARLDCLDTKVSTRSALTLSDIPMGLTAEQFWTYANRTLTSTVGLTPSQASALEDIQTQVSAKLDVKVSSRVASSEYIPATNPQSLPSLTGSMAEFFREFSVACRIGNYSFRGIFDCPDDTFGLGGINMQSTSYSLMVRTTDITEGQILQGSAIAVQDINYTVRDIVAEDDGAISRLNLTKQ